MTTIENNKTTLNFPTIGIGLQIERPITRHGSRSILSDNTSQNTVFSSSNSSPVSSSSNNLNLNKKFEVFFSVHFVKNIL